MTRIRRMF